MLNSSLQGSFKTGLGTDHFHATIIGQKKVGKNGKAPRARCNNSETGHENTSSYLALQFLYFKLSCHYKKIVYLYAVFNAAKYLHQIFTEYLDRC